MFLVTPLKLAASGIDFIIEAAVLGALYAFSPECLSGTVTT